MKKAQTRLENRLLRPRQENCRDNSQYGYVLYMKNAFWNIVCYCNKVLSAGELGLQKFIHRLVRCFRLVDEVRSISESVSALKAQLQQAEKSLCGLLKARGDLEREIIVKRKSLQIDRDRCQEIRSHYPSTVALTGY